MPYLRMTLQQRARYQERALQTYLSRWNFWKHYRSRYLSGGGSVKMTRCRGVRAPAWACWNLEASIWTKHELADTLAAITARVAAMPISSMTYAQLEEQSSREIANGGIYSMRWGDASPRLRSLCYEMVGRAFSRFGTQQWALAIVERESGCNPGAVNTTYSAWEERAQCIAQLIPRYHTWVDYVRCKRDIGYAIAVFVRLSRGGTSVGPWRL